MYKGLFVIEDVLGPYPGYTDGKRWNGWETPYFEYDVALQMTEDWKVGEVGETDAYYDVGSDQFCFCSETGEDWECFPAVMREVEGETRKLYPIGAFNWIWDDA